MLRMCLSLFFLGLVIGCGEGEVENTLPDTFPVTGVVTLDEKPLASAKVSFIPAAGTDGTVCEGTTDESGKYSLTQQHGAEGAPVGSYKVVVSLLLRADGTPVPAEGAGDGLVAVETLPAQYSDANTTTLKAEVQAGGSDFKFDLKSK
jgi:hypothetical protein